MPDPTPKTDTSTPSDLEVLTYRSDGRTVSFTLDESLYPRDVIYGAAYLFIDKCFIFLARPEDKAVEVRLKSRQASGSEDLEELAGSFANSLLDQLVRFRVSESTGRCPDHSVVSGG